MQPTKSAWEKDQVTLPPPTMLITKWSTTNSLSMGANDHWPQAGDSKMIKAAAGRVGCGLKVRRSAVNFKKLHTVCGKL